MLGIETFLEILAAARVRYIFGNPGSTELPLNDALANDSRFQYIFGLHELPLTAMADGYAMASGGLGVVCVHISCGLGNAMAMLYNAYCAGTPLLLLAGQQDRRLRLGEPVLEGDTVSVNAQYKILKVSGAVMQLPHMTQKKYLGMDLAEPEVDFVGLARSFGVKAHQVTEPDELSERVCDSLNQTEPILLNVPIER